MTGAEFVDKLSAQPLLHQPGAVWDYGFGLDVLGQVVVVLGARSVLSLGYIIIDAVNYDTDASDPPRGLSR